MTRQNVIIYGAGYLGEQYLHHVSSYFPQVGVLGFADDVRAPGETVVAGLQTLGALADVATVSATAPGAVKIVFAIGYANMLARAGALDRVTTQGYDLFTIVHPQALIEPNARIGDGSVVLAGAVVDQAVQVGAACFVDIGVRLGAGTKVGRNSYLSSGTSTGSRAIIGDSCFIGMDCTITTDVEVGDNVFINAKTLVPRNIPSDTKVVQVHKSRNLPQPR